MTAFSTHARSPLLAQRHHIVHDTDHECCLQVQNVLGSLIQFVTDNPGRDPLNLEGSPVRSRQRFLREQGVIEMLVNILQQSFVDGRFVVCGH